MIELPALLALFSQPPMVILGVIVGVLGLGVARGWVIFKWQLTEILRAKDRLLEELERAKNRLLEEKDARLADRAARFDAFEALLRQTWDERYAELGKARDEEAEAQEALLGAVQANTEAISSLKPVIDAFARFLKGIGEL